CLRAFVQRGGGKLSPPMLSAARFTMASAPSARCPQPAAVFASYFTSSTPGGVLPRCFSGLRLSEITSCPSAARLSASAVPISPVPPVIMTLIGSPPAAYHSLLLVYFENCVSATGEHRARRESVSESPQPGR